MKENTKKVLVSGVQSSGILHIGNYFGAIKQNIDLANSGDTDGEQYDPYIFIADYHSMTTLTDSDARRKNVFDTACTYLACGLDVSRSALFTQSSVPAHTELAWILSTVTPMPMLELAHSYKDKVGDESKKYEISAGLFTYPVLMASDILMYNASIVPVGKDQLQHVEYAREIAGKYNRAYSNSDFTFNMPEAYIKDDVMIVPGLDGSKMSKSKGNVIPIFASDEEYKKAIAGIVTDSARPEDKKVASENNIYKIHSLFLSDAEREVLKGKFENASLESPYGYKQAKDELLETIIRYFSPMRDRYFYYQRNPDEVSQILAEGATRAHSLSDINMQAIRRQVGLR